MDVKAVTTNFFFEGVFSPVPSFLSFFLHFAPSLTPPFSHPEVAPLAKGFGGVLVS